MNSTLSLHSLRNLLVLILLLAPLSLAAEDGERLNLYLFVGQGCPHCEAQLEFLHTLQQSHPTLHIELYEVTRSRTHHDRYIALAQAHGIEPGSVPTGFLGGKSWVGDGEAIRREIARQVVFCLQNGCPDAGLAYGEGRLGNIDLAQPSDRSRSLHLPRIGEVDLQAQSLLLSTVLIAFIDGFNPCSLWVLTILLALVIHSGSRWRIALIGGTFLATTGLIYGLFITSAFSIVGALHYMQWIYWLVALLALLFAVVNIKDYFWFQRGLSFTIDERHKPGIYRRIRALLGEGRNPLALVGLTIVMAAGIAIIELPCTAGFPVIWSGLLAQHEVSWLDFALLLSLYLFVYLLIELIILLVALTSLRIGRFEERHGRLLKLIGGMIMLALALVLVIDPQRMSDPTAAFGVFALALLASAVVLVLHRVLLPRCGVQIGDDDQRQKGGN